MRQREYRLAERSNDVAANIVSASGPLQNIMGYLSDGSGAVQDFLVSGGDSFQRLSVLQPVIDACIGAMPVIALHNQDSLLESLLVECHAHHWENGNGVELKIANADAPLFEPLLGFDGERVVNVVRELAKKLGFNPTPRLRRVVLAHLAILEKIDVPVSLSGLHYLCGFTDMGVFHDNVMVLGGSPAENQRIWADLGVDDAGGEQFDLFRATISALAHSAVQCGWSGKEAVSECNCFLTLRQGEPMTFSLSIGSEGIDVMLSYLCEELYGGNRPYLLVIDGVRIIDERFSLFLRQQGTGATLALIGDNVVDLVSGSQDDFPHYMEKMGGLVLFKHGTATVADKLSGVMGEYDSLRISESRGSGKGFFSLLPDSSHREVSQALESRYRVMPQDIISLDPDQAILFNARTNQVIRYN